MRKIINAFICLVGILGLTLVLIEVASRLYFSEQNYLSITARKSSEEVLSSYFSRTRATIPQESDDEYILFIGDSFTYGDTLSKDEAYPKVFERCIQRKGSKLKVINGAVQGTGILDHAQLLERFLTKELSHLKIKRVIMGLVKNDRYIEPWGFHPYDACSDLYPYSNTRFLHHNFFSLYYLDYLVNKKSHYDLKDQKTEECFNRSFNKIKEILKERKIPLTTTFLADAVKTPTSDGVIGLNYMNFLKTFEEDFSFEYIVINKVFDSISSEREVYSHDNYHFNASTNALIGEYLCDQIKI